MWSGRVPSGGSGARPEYWIAPLESESDLDGVLEVEAESFTNPWTRAMYQWELQHRSVCHIYVVRTAAAGVVGFCAFWLIVDEMHINNVATRPAFRGQGIGAALMAHVLGAARPLGAQRATLEVRESNTGALRFYERLGFRIEGRRRRYYTSPVEDALILWWPDRAVSVPAHEDASRG
jgi:[ribosomal protein S18]-alanine N-acetyltransferase